MMHNYQLIITYDGTAYSGWQIQPNGITIQALIQKGIKLILGEDVVVIGSGRTDSGVHALAQVAHFHCHSSINLFKFHKSLNAVLPRDIRIKAINEVPMNFHAQHSAKSKIYHYHLHLNRIQDPFKRLYGFHITSKIDLNALKQAAQYFLGRHDFTSFANEAHKGSASIDAVRTLKRLDVIEHDEGIRLEFEADGFLYRMVRNITGTLLEVALGKKSASAIPTIILAKDRRQAGMAAPPQGLFLVHVEYLDF